MAYDIFYWLHIVAYVVWLLAFAGSIFYGLRVKLNGDTIQKHKLMRVERLISSIGVHIGAVGILISGWVMVTIPSGPQWGWMNIQLYPWLTLKQILFVIILVMVGISIKRSMAFKKRLRRESEAGNAKTMKEWKSAYRISMGVYILVVVSTILGLTKFNLAF